MVLSARSLAHVGTEQPQYQWQYQCGPWQAGIAQASSRAGSVRADLRAASGRVDSVPILAGLAGAVVGVLSHAVAAVHSALHGRTSCVDQQGRQQAARATPVCHSCRGNVLVCQVEGTFPVCHLRLSKLPCRPPSPAPPTHRAGRPIRWGVEELAALRACASGLGIGGAAANGGALQGTARGIQQSMV